MFLIRCQHNVNLGIKSQTPNVERKHFNALYKPVFCFAKQCNGSNKVSLFYLLVWGVYRSPCLIETRWKACIALLCFGHLYNGTGKFHLKGHMVVWCEGNLGWEVVSPSLSLELLDLLKAQRQSDAYTCLRLVIRGSEVGSRDAIPPAGSLIHIPLSQDLATSYAAVESHTRACLLELLIFSSLPLCFLYSTVSHFFGENNRYFCSRKKAS